MVRRLLRWPAQHHNPAIRLRVTKSKTVHSRTTQLRPTQIRATFQIASQANRIRLIPTAMRGVLALSSSKLLLYPLQSIKKSAELGKIPVYTVSYPTRLTFLPINIFLPKSGTSRSLTSHIVLPPHHLHPSTPAYIPIAATSAPGLMTSNAT